MLQKILNNYLSSNKPNTIFALLFFISLFLISLVCIINGKMGNDPGRWSYIGRIWIENDMPPYKDSIENKTPGIFILYAISHYFFGINYFFPRSLGALTIILTSVLLFKVGKKIHDKHVGLIGAMIFSLSMFWEVINSNYVGHTETFMVFFSTATFYLLLINHYDAKLYLFLIKGFFFRSSYCF